MASSHNVELEAAKFLYKVIQDSNDDPAKLATKLHVILQHMESTAKEHLMTCQVISRAVETLINQHDLDIEALNSSRLPLCGGSSQAVGVAKDSRVGLAENEMPKMDPFASGRAPVAPSITSRNGKLLMKGRGGRKSHDVWEGVTKLYGDRVMCRHCKFEFAAPSATRIRSHLYSIPNKGIRGCPNFGQAATGSSERDKNIARSCNLEVASRIASSTRERNKVNETQKGTTLQLQVDTKKKRISYQVGPFSISHDKYDELDMQLIQYVFDPSRNPSEEVVIFPHYHLKRSEFTTLGPEAFLNAMVIDVFAENLTKIEEEKMKIKPSRNWYLPLLFSQFALDSDASSCVERHNMKNDFMPSDLVNCDKIFIPIHIGSNSCGHFYLYVVHLKRKVVEIFDSLPSYTTEKERNEKTQKLLLVLDKLFENDKSKSWAFAKFSAKMAENIPKQSNSFDCGIFVIKFLKDSANAMNNKLFESDKERLDLALELLKSELNKERETLFNKAALWYYVPHKEYQQMEDANHSPSIVIPQGPFIDCNDLEIIRTEFDQVKSSGQGARSSLLQDASCDQETRRTLLELETVLIVPDGDDEVTTSNTSLGDSSRPSTSGQRNRSWSHECQGSEYIQSQPSYVLSSRQSNEVAHVEKRHKSMEEALLQGFPSSNLKHLLIACAKALSESNMKDFDQLIEKARSAVSISGEPIQRLGAYLVEGLVARKEVSGNNIYRALKCREPEGKDLRSLMLLLYEICPYLKFGYTAANGAIAEACRNEDRIHIIDFQIAQGTQWVILLLDLAARPGGAPHVRITGIDDAVSKYARGDGLEAVGRRLAIISENFGIPIEFYGVPVFGLEVTRGMLDVRPGEALAVNFPLRLHHMADESVDVRNPRDRLLRMVKALSPKVVTLMGHESKTNTTPFFNRFVETLDYNLAIFESIDVTLPRNSKERINVEQHCLARYIVNIIACEGKERVERHELFGKWKSRLTMAGFHQYPLSSHVNSVIRSLLRCYSEHYTLVEKDGAMFLGWKNRNLISASAWH